MKITRIVSLGVLLAIVSGCNSYSSPKAVLGSAYRAIEKNEFKAFRRTFSDEFRKSHDMTTLMADLKGRLDGLQMSAADPVELSHKMGERRICRPMLSYPMLKNVVTERTYEVTIEGEKAGTTSPVLSAEVTCAVVFSQTYVRSIMTYCNDPIGEYCKISALR